MVRRKLASLVYSKGHTKISRGGSREEKSGLRAKEGGARTGMTSGTVMWGPKGEAGAMVGSKSQGN